jgi:arylsulfatase
VAQCAGDDARAVTVRSPIDESPSGKKNDHEPSRSRRRLRDVVRSRTHRARAGAAPRPNIVLILADDLGFSDLSCYGSEIPTPNIDRLAERGVRFTDFYNQSRCCPTRAALMTGRYPHQVGIGAMIDAYAKWIRDAADRPSYQDRLSPDSPTLAELLRTAGYRTIMCGKWHLGSRPSEWPVNRGLIVRSS